MSDDQTFLIAITVDHDSRLEARAHLYDVLGGLLRDRKCESWWDATMDHADGHDNGEAVWTHPDRGIEAQHALVTLGLAPETDERIGHHPQVYVIRDGGLDDGNVLMFQCARCGETSDHPAVLAEVPCIDLSKWEHGHYWVSGDLFVDSTDVEITCIADCGMTIVNGQAVGAVSTEHAGSPPDYDN